MVPIFVKHFARHINIYFAKPKYTSLKHVGIISKNISGDIICSFQRWRSCNLCLLLYTSRIVNLACNNNTPLCSQPRVYFTWKQRWLLGWEHSCSTRSCIVLGLDCKRWLSKCRLCVCNFAQNRSTDQVSPNTVFWQHDDNFSPKSVYQWLQRTTDFLPVCAIQVVPNFIINAFTLCDTYNNALISFSWIICWTLKQQ